MSGLNGKSAVGRWIVCLGGEDWWYHSHAHFDIQVMKRLSRFGPLLYVCSTGMRVPSLRNDALFWTRIRNKAVSMSRGLRRVNSRLYVFSPITIPAHQRELGRSLNRALLTAQFRSVYARLGIREPLVWINTPTAWPAARRLNHRGVVYQRTDDYAAYTLDNFNAAYVRDIDEELLRGADLVLHVSDYLHRRDGGRATNALLLEQGVDERFLRAEGNGAAPADLAKLRRPIVGYVGNMEPYKFDAELVYETAAGLPDYSFALVGADNQNVARLRSLDNVHFLGRKPHEEIPAYVRAFDVCMLPTARSEWGMKCNPIKLMEYLATGRPVVSTHTPATKRFAEFVRAGDSPAEWIEAIRECLDRGECGCANAKTRMIKCTWRRQSDRIRRELARSGLMSGDEERGA